MPLTTIDKVKAYLGPSVISGTTEDDFIADLILEKQSEIETYCNRHFDVNSYQEIHRVNHIICPNEYPIKTIDKIEYLTGDEVFEITDYELLQSYIKLLDLQYVTMTGNLQYVSNREKDVRITYTAGYEDNEIPADLRLACTKLAVLEYKESRSNTLGLDSESEGDVRYTYSKRETPSTIISILNNYKRKFLI